MKKYGVRNPQTEYVYFAVGEWYPNCVDKDSKFGTNDINEAYRFTNYYISTQLEVFEKN